MFEYIELFFLGYFAALTPGPDSLFVLKNSFVSLKNAFLSVFGILLGNIIYLSFFSQFYREIKIILNRS